MFARCLSLLSYSFSLVHPFDGSSVKYRRGSLSRKNRSGVSEVNGADRTVSEKQIRQLAVASSVSEREREKERGKGERQRRKAKEKEKG